MTARIVIVGLGEVLWDVFPDGPRFGGAPANFACSAAGLGRPSAEVFMVSAVGEDELGTRARASLQNRGVDTSCVAIQPQQTGRVDIELDDEGKASYEFAADTAWDNLQWSADSARLAGMADVVCFGTLGQRCQRSRTTIQQFVSATTESAIRIFDINLRPPFYGDDVILESLETANVLKLNDEELPLLATLCGLQGSDPELLRQLCERFALTAAALTRGPHGAVLVRGKEVSEHSGVPVDVVDTVGAGDAFTAALAIGLRLGDELAAINERASRVAAYVCSQPGATPEIPTDL